MTATCPFPLRAPVSLRSIWEHCTQYLQSTERTRQWHMASYLEQKLSVYDSSFDSITNLIVNFVLHKRTTENASYLIKEYDSFKIMWYFIVIHEYCPPRPLFISLIVAFPNSFLLPFGIVFFLQFWFIFGWNCPIWFCITALGSGAVSQDWPWDCLSCFPLLSMKIRGHWRLIKFCPNSIFNYANHHILWYFIHNETLVIENSTVFKISFY